MTDLVRTAIARLAPRRLLVVGREEGLVEQLRRDGVDALAYEPPGGVGDRYDLVLCLGRPDPAADAAALAATLAALADRVLVSAPTGGSYGGGAADGEALLAWMRPLGAQGFWPNPDEGAAGPDLVLMRQRPGHPSAEVLRLSAERARRPVSPAHDTGDALAQARQAILEACAGLALCEGELASVRRIHAEQTGALGALRADLQASRQALSRQATRLLAAREAEGKLARLEASRAWRLARRIERVTAAIGLGRPRGGKGPDLRRAIDRVEASGLFDRAWYLSTYPDVAGSGQDPVEHYLIHGAAEGRNPNAGFDTLWYLENNADVAGDGANPFDHWIRNGAAEGRDPGPSFRKAAYLARHPEVEDTTFGPFLHFLRHPPAEAAPEPAGPAPALPDPSRPGTEPERSAAEVAGIVGRVAASGLFDAVWYAERAGRSFADYDEALEDYVRRGSALGLGPNPLFDGAWYRARYADVRESGIHPLDHYVAFGAAERRDPGPLFSARRYLDAYPHLEQEGDLLAHYIGQGIGAGLQAFAVPYEEKTSAALLAKNYDFIRALPTYAAPASGTPRLTLVTDSVGPGSLFGGVGTALVFAALLANRRGARLRIVTLREKPSTAGIEALFASHGVPLHRPITFAFADIGSTGRPIDVEESDTFVTTSWWSTQNLLGAVDPRRIVYIVQEDERMFYAGGDDHLRCCEASAAPGLRYVVNTRLLYDHLRCSGFPQMGERGTWFEPAFPLGSYFHEPIRREGLNLFFYARPGNPRNLFHRGIEALDAALLRGVIDPDLWTIHCVGSHLPDFAFAGGVAPRKVEGLSWTEYTRFIRRMDLGLSLMYTPHPSYPPLDMAASGGVCVSNVYGAKTSLAAYSENIVCTGLSVDEIVEGLRAGAALAQDLPRRAANYRKSNIQRDWGASFEGVFQFLNVAR